MYVLQYVPNAVCQFIQQGNKGGGAAGECGLAKQAEVIMYHPRCLSLMLPV